MSARKAKAKRAPSPPRALPTKLLWLEAALVVLAGHPNRLFLKALAVELSQYGPPDGSKVNPSRSTLMTGLKASTRSVDRGLGDLIEVELLEVVKRYQHYPTTYRRTIPRGADEHHKFTGGDRASTSDVATSDVATCDADEHHDLLPPNEVKEEEEECAGAPCAVAPVAAHLPTTTEPATVGQVTDEALHANGDGAVADADDGDAERIEMAVEGIAKRAGVAIDTKRLGPAVAGAMARTGWSAAEVSVYCVDKLQRLGRRVGDPSAFLATDLGRLDDGIVASPRMKYAAAIERLSRLDEEIEATGGDRRAVTRFEEVLAQAELIARMDGYPDVWDAKPAQLALLTHLAAVALHGAKRR